MYPELCRYGEVDVLLAGVQVDVSFPYPIRYRLPGISYIFGKKGGVDVRATLRSFRLIRLLRDIITLPVKSYDLVVNDHEAISAWACRLRRIMCVSLSHQCAVLHDKAPKPSPKKGKRNTERYDALGKWLLKNFAPYTAAYGFHFRAFAENIFTPVIRSEVRQMTPKNNGHYTVYLPAYDDEALVRHLSHFPNVRWEVFSKHNKIPFTKGNISVTPIENDAFIRSMADSTGVLCGAGFETPAEALFLGKKVLAIPMLQQYEQDLNAAGLINIGVPVIDLLDEAHYNDIAQWTESDERIVVDYPDQVQMVIAKMMREQMGVSLKDLPEIEEQSL